MMKRRRFKQTLSLRERLDAYAADLRDRARRAASDADRDRLARLAGQADAASHMAEWLASPGLQSPK